MGIEERIERLEITVSNLSNHLKSIKNEKWVTPNELAEIMSCSVNNIYIKIRSGEIYATDKLGSIKRIPMSQFYKVDHTNTDDKVLTFKNEKEELSIKERVFG